jgi:hypothetical protein
MRWLLVPLPLVLIPFVALITSACDGSSGAGTAGSGGGTAGSGGAMGGSGGTGATGGNGGSGGSGGGLAPGECRENEDCAGNGEYCAVEGPSYCGGAGCLLTACVSDGDCQAMGLFVCEAIGDCCNGTYCIQGCDGDDPCPVGQACTADSHCVPQPCIDEGCPANFDCGGGADPTCARRACSSDAECQGYCVLGACYDKLGFCDLPKP